jgi:dolichol-phosphate mannosyltransferase
MNLSLIIPTLNEEENIKPLVIEIHKNLKNNYEIIFIDDHSTDNTIKEIKKLSKNIPIKVFLKKGKRGKTFSLIEGFEKARFEILGMIDADLQYPPKYLPNMLGLVEKGADVVITNRSEYKAPISRKIISKLTGIIITLFFDLNFDTQSGLKIFKKEVYKSIPIKTENEWTFDIDFLVRAKRLGYKIKSINIEFQPRVKGESKTQMFTGTKRGILKEAIKLKVRKD